MIVTFCNRIDGRVLEIPGLLKVETTLRADEVDDGGVVHEGRTYYALTYYRYALDDVTPAALQPAIVEAIAGAHAEQRPAVFLPLRAWSMTGVRDE